MALTFDEFCTVLSRNEIFVTAREIHNLYFSYRISHCIKVV